MVLGKKYFPEIDNSFNSFVNKREPAIFFIAAFPYKKVSSIQRFPKREAHKADICS